MVLQLLSIGGSTALHWAMDGKNHEMIDWMMDDGADIHATDHNGWTPLLRVGRYYGSFTLPNTKAESDKICTEPMEICIGIGLGAV